jgi:glucokinase
MNIIGIDIGGTNISAVLCKEGGKVTNCFSRKTAYYENDYLRNVLEIIQILINSSNVPVSSIGIGVPGIVNIDDNIIEACPALEWNNLDLKKIIEDKFKIYTSIGNDVNNWTIAERYLGKGKGCKNFVVITIGTGIGCGLYINDKLYLGSTYEAGEIGYMPLGLDSFNKEYTYADFGFFESKASALSVSNHYYEKSGEKLSCDEIFNLSYKGLKNAVEVREETYKYISIGIASIIALLNPSKIIIGGGMTNEGDLFLKEIIENVSKLTPIKSEICISELGEMGGALGSALASIVSPGKFKD